MKQVYGIATYDALFKYVLSEDSIRPSFFRAFIPDLDIVSSERLDDHMNPLQRLQLLRSFLNADHTSEVVSRLSTDPKTKVSSSFGELGDPQATAFLHELLGRFEELQIAFPEQKYDGTMDFVCRLSNGELALVEMQVRPQNYWDRRALAYVALCYGNQLYKGDQFQHIKKAIGINILGGGKDALKHWQSSPEEYVRHYKFQDQLNNKDRIIDGMELIQYSIMNAPKDPLTQEQNDWITFFKEGHLMTEEKVKETIQTESVRVAFRRAKLNELPAKVLSGYEAEDTQYERYSDFTDKKVEEGREEGREEGIAIGEERGIVIGEERGKFEKALEMARKMKKDGLSIEVISNYTGLSKEEIEGLA